MTTTKHALLTTVQTHEGPVAACSCGWKSEPQSTDQQAESAHRAHTRTAARPSDSRLARLADAAEEVQRTVNEVLLQASQAGQDDFSQPRVIQPGSPLAAAVAAELAAHDRFLALLEEPRGPVLDQFPGADV